MLKKITKIFLWLTIVIVWLVSTAFFNGFYNEIKISNIKVNFISDNYHDLITKSEVSDMLSSYGIVKGVTLREEFNIEELEKKFLDHLAVESAEVYFVNNGTLTINIKKRTPVGRFISTTAEKNFYIDDRGCLMPLCSTYVAKVPLFSGNINFFESVNVYSSNSLNSLPIINKLYKMSQLINNDSFLKSQIVQIHINNNGYFELIPRIGNQRIMFGTPLNMEKKLKKIKLFYTNGPSAKELNLYDTLNVMYNNQIICSKRI